MRLILAVALAAMTIGAVPARAAQSFDIPVILSLTGGGAFLGRQEHQALIVEEKLVNQSGGIHGAPVHFSFADDQSSPQLAVQLTAAALATSRRSFSARPTSPHATRWRRWSRMAR